MWSTEMGELSRPDLHDPIASEERMDGDDDDDDYDDDDEEASLGWSTKASQSGHPDPIMK